MLPPDALVGRYEALADALIHGAEEASAFAANWGVGIPS